LQLGGVLDAAVEVGARSEATGVGIVTGEEGTGESLATAGVSGATDADVRRRGGAAGVRPTTE
jgi:hypothetical protein